MNPVAKIKDWSSRSTEFYGDVRSEMRKVSWPARDEVMSTTVVVLVAVAFFGAYLAIVDTVLGAGVNQIFGLFGSGG